MTIEILQQCSWSNSHIAGNLTKIKCNGIVAYVRENVRYDSFRMSANVRLGVKCGQMPPDAVQVLELCAPKEYWDEIAQEVQQLDGLEREVVRGRFGCEWAENQFR